MKTSKLKRSLRCGLAVLGFLAIGSIANAAVSVSWTSPANNSVYPAGEMVMPTGQASAFGGTGGTGLDLALVIDTSGSMGFNGGIGLSSAKAAATALVNALPAGTTSVAVIEFNSSANTVRVLTPLSTNTASVLAGINSLTAGGLTNIGSGIAAAASELTGTNHTLGRSQQMVVLSDGVSSGNPGASADAAILAGVDAIHSVGIPGHNVGQMQGIVDGPDNVLGNADDHGVYTSGDLTALTNLFAGTGGNLVGIDRVDLTLPDGTFFGSVPVDGLGNFKSPGYNLAPGANVFNATAYDTQGNSASADLTLFGRQSGGGTGNRVPDGGSSLLMLAMALGLGRFAMRFARN